MLTLASIKRMIPVSAKMRMLYHLSHASGRYGGANGRPKVIVALAADYANQGDLAITYAQVRFIEKCLPDREVLLFPCASTFPHMKDLKRVCKAGDTVTIIGGGNMSDVYDSLEDARRFIITQFPDNRIVSFPQTIWFSDTVKGRRELGKTKAVYDRHQNLHLFARELISFELMTACFPSKPVHLAPDIVLSLDEREPRTKRQGVLVCIRDDWESAFSRDARDLFVARLASEIPGASCSDTVTRNLGRLSSEEADGRFMEALCLFRQAEVVVTDRLHGMIFAAITGTPCVVLENSNHKIRGTYDAWLSTLDHVVLQQGFDADETMHRVEALRKIDASAISTPDLSAKFSALRSAVSGGMG